jgi:Fe-S-cluster containining protein
MPKQSKETTKEAQQRRICQELCEARCCRYITIHIDAPRLKADFDEISWFLAHENISVYFHGRRWHVEVRNRCKYLTRNNLCSAYDDRPLVCRSYDSDECEYPDRPKHDLHFDTKQEFDAWWARKRERERRRRRRRARAARSR